VNGESKNIRSFNLAILSLVDELWGTVAHIVFFLGFVADNISDVRLNINLDLCFSGLVCS
jgi:hypothetical protein